MREREAIFFVSLRQPVDFVIAICLPMQTLAEDLPYGAEREIEVVRSRSDAVLRVRREVIFHALDVFRRYRGSPFFVFHCATSDSPGLVEPLNKPLKCSLMRDIAMIPIASKLSDEGSP